MAKTIRLRYTGLIAFASQVFSLFTDAHSSELISWKNPIILRLRVT